jgi:hypothetical protein
MGFSNEKIPYLGWWPSMQGGELPSTQVPCWESTALFPPTPTLLAPHTHTYDIFKIAENDVSTSKIFLANTHPPLPLARPLLSAQATFAS